MTQHSMASQSQMFLENLGVKTRFSSAALYVVSHKLDSNLESYLLEALKQAARDYLNAAPAQKKFCLNNHCFSVMPRILLRLIFQNLKPSTLFKICRVSKAFRQSITNKHSSPFFRTRISLYFSTHQSILDDLNGAPLCDEHVKSTSSNPLEDVELRICSEHKANEKCDINSKLKYLIPLLQRGRESEISCSNGCIGREFTYVGNALLATARHLNLLRTHFPQRLLARCLTLDKTRSLSIQGHHLLVATSSKFPKLRHLTVASYFEEPQVSLSHRVEDIFQLFAFPAPCMASQLKSLHIIYTPRKEETSCLPFCQYIVILAGYLSGMKSLSVEIRPTTDGFTFTSWKEGRLGETDASVVREFLVASQRKMALEKICCWDTWKVGSATLYGTVLKSWLKAFNVVDETTLVGTKKPTMLA